MAVDNASPRGSGPTSPASGPTSSASEPRSQALAAATAGPLDDTEPLGPPHLGWRFWVAVAVFWAFFGFVVGNHLYFSMRAHGHSWGRIVLWQMGGAAAWIVLTPAVLALDRRFALRPGSFRRALPFHTGTALLFAAFRLVPLTALSRLLDPFRPVPREETFVGEYTQLLREWLFLDLMVYVGILVLAYALEHREHHYRDRLRASHLRAELSAAELRALELEIHPHFLFNALNAIAVLVRGGERERASGMIVALADLLRSTLKRRGRLFLSLAEELEHVRLYLDLQKARFQDRLEVTVELDCDARRTEVPGLVLQPLVENAFRHGIEQRRGPGRVRIRAARAGARLELEVQDNGPGLRPGAERGNGAGIGLSNLRSRLRALYDDRWSLDLESREGAGTLARVTIPWQETGS